MMSEQIAATVRQMGYRLTVIDSPTAGRDAKVMGEPLYGPGAAIVEELTRWHPALLIFDVGSTVLPWEQWLPVIKSVPATRRLPAIAYGPHVEEAKLALAKDCGADVVVSRGKFLNSLPGLIEKYAKVVDVAGLDATCAEPLSALARQGIAEFNAGEYFEAHETLEHAWNEDTGVGRDLYRAILQVAVAYLQIERGNYRGALKMFLRVRQWIDPLPAVCRGVDIGQLRADAAAVEAAVQALGPERIGEFDRGLFRGVRLVGK